MGQYPQKQFRARLSSGRARGSKHSGLELLDIVEHLHNRVIHGAPGLIHLLLTLEGLLHLLLRTRQGTRAGRTTPAGAQKINPPNPTVLAWSHVYLGRLHDVADERDQAVVEYRAALAVSGAPEAALVAAQRGIATPYAPAAEPGAGAKPPDSQKK